MRKFYEHVLGTSWEVEHLPRPRKERSLPSVLSKEEVSSLLNHGRTLKHQAFMALLYGTGLRLSEALNLHILDIDALSHHLESGTAL
jgi:integrase/recombinase XerD